MVEYNTPRGAAVAVPADLARKLMFLRIMGDHLRTALTRNEAIAEKLIQRYVNNIPLVEDEDFRHNLLHDVNEAYAVSIDLAVYGAAIVDTLSTIVIRPDISDGT